MAKKIGSLAVFVNANTAALKKGLKGAAQDVNGFGSMIGNALGGVQSTVLGLAASFIGVGLSVSHLKEVADNIDRTAKSADRLNMTTEALTSLTHHAQLAGMEAGEFDSAMTTMYKNVGLAAMGTGKAGKALEELGIDSKKLSKLSGENQFKVIAEALGEVENSTIRAALASRIFGGDAAKMLNVIEGGVPAIEAGQASSEALAESLNRFDSAKVEMANDALSEVAKVVDGIQQQLVVALAPIVTQIAKDFIAWSQSGKTWKEVVFNAVDVVGHGIASLLDLIDYGKIAWEALKIAGNAALWGITKAVWAVGEGLTKLIDMAADYLPDSFVQGAHEAQDTLTALTAEFESNMKASKDKIEGIWNGPAWGSKLDGYLQKALRDANALAEAMTEGKPTAQPYGNSREETRTKELKKQLDIAENMKAVNFEPNNLIRAGSAQAQAAPFAARQKSADAATNKQIALANKALDTLRKIEKNTSTDEDDEPFG